MKRKLLGVLLLLLASGLLTGLAGAQTGAPIGAQAGAYTLNWFTVEGGGETMAASGYRLSGTAGQADAGRLTGSGYSLSGGFWAGGAAAAGTRFVYLPLVTR